MTDTAGQERKTSQVDACGGEPNGDGDTRVFAGKRRGHDHHWCSKECLDAACEFGPCCYPEPIEMVPHTEAIL